MEAFSEIRAKRASVEFVAQVIRVLQPLKRLLSSQAHPRVYCFDSVTSTMDVAKIIAERSRLPLPEELGWPLFEGAEVGASEGSIELKAIIIAREQQQGRGRFRRSWLSSRNQGLYLTYLITAPCEPQQLAGFSLATGVAILRTLRRFGIKAALKWPNDIVACAVGESRCRKLAGVLSELVSADGENLDLSIGVGINLLPSEELSAIGAVSLAELRGLRVLQDVAEEATNKDTKSKQMGKNYFELLGLFSQDLLEVSALFFRDGFRAFRDEWLRRTMMIGKKVVFADKEAGRVYLVLGVDSSGGLVVREVAGESKEKVFYGGEFRLIELDCD